MSDDEPARLVLSFDNDEPLFARGVEIGMLWQRLQVEPLPLHAVVHVSNAEMVLRVAEAMNATVTAGDPGAAQTDWLALEFSASSSWPAGGSS